MPLSKLGVAIGSFGLAVSAGLSLAAQEAAAPVKPDSPPRGDRALIVVGLSGDSQHETRFRDTARAWRDWLSGPLKFPAAGIRILFGEKGNSDLAAGPATAKAIADEVASIQRSLAPDGRLWVFTLGHANEREDHAYLHLPGPDLSDGEFGALFSGITCREQVFWLTTPGSGWFLSGLSAKGRIVITATTRDQEFNETEFPQALVDVSKLAPAELDADKDGKVSVWELFVRTSENVQASFDADMRAPTEHAWLDDDGDKLGSERPEPPSPTDAAKEKTADSKLKDTAKPKAAAPKLKDGELAKKTFLPG